MLGQRWKSLRDHGTKTRSSRSVIVYSSPADLILLPQGTLCKCKGFDEYAAQVRQTFLSMFLSLTKYTLFRLWPVVCFGPYILVNLVNDFTDFNSTLLQPKLFIKSENISRRVMASTTSPNRLIYFQSQEYTTRFLKKKKACPPISNPRKRGLISVTRSLNLSLL